MDLDNILRIIKNVINNAQTAADAVSDAVETPLGEKVITVISVVIIAAVVVIAAAILGALLHMLVKLLNGDLGCALGLTVGAVIFAFGSKGIGWFGVLTAIAVTASGTITAIAMLKLIRDHDLSYAEKHKDMNYTFAALYSFFIVGVFIISPQMYDILPLKLNKWCLYIAEVVLSYNSMTGIWYSLADNRENKQL